MIHITSSSTMSKRSEFLHTIHTKIGVCLVGVIDENSLADLKEKRELYRELSKCISLIQVSNDSSLHEILSQTQTYWRTQAVEISYVAFGDREFYKNIGDYVSLFVRVDRLERVEPEILFERIQKLSERG